jgi:hypothetical protein
MMKMNRALAALGLVCAVGGANAALVGRDIDGNAVAGNAASSVFLYDTVLNITWLRNANANGAMNWDQANTWASGLNSSATGGGFAGWRLPTMMATGLPGGDQTDNAWNVPTKSGNKTQYEPGQTVYSEMASLYYDTLGNKAYYDASGAFQADHGIRNKGDFLNLGSTYYWFGLELAGNTNYAWYFGTFDGRQNYNGKSADYHYAMAVRDGDVLATPIPAAAWLMLSGIGALGAAARRRKSTQVKP